MRIFSLLLLGLLAIAQPAEAQGQAPSGAQGGPTAAQLMAMCLEGAASGAVSNSVCTGYLAGFIGAIRIARTVTEDFPICLPNEGLTNQQVVNDVSAYLEGHQDQLERSARSVFFLVLTQEYPCSQ